MVWGWMRMLVQATAGEGGASVTGEQLDGEGAIGGASQLECVAAMQGVQGAGGSVERCSGRASNSAARVLGSSSTGCTSASLRQRSRRQPLDW